MKAILLSRYGDIEDVSFGETEQPTPKDGELLVRVHASAVNDWELGIIRASPAFMRVFLGLTRPKVRILGVDMSGVVETVGNNVSRFKPGDEVYGDLSEVGFGAFAEYVCVPEKAVERKPANIGHEEAATVPHAAGLAIQGLRDMGALESGQRLLINGAGGGVGVLGIQYAKMIGADITGVDKTVKLDFMRTLGCDAVIDYTQENFTQGYDKYDLILDNKSFHSPMAYARVLNTGSRYVSVGGSMVRIVQILLLGPVYRRVMNKHLQVLGLKANTGLADMTSLIESGDIKPLVGGTFELKDASAALRAFEASDQGGRIVIKVA